VNTNIHSQSFENSLLSSAGENSNQNNNWLN